MYKKGVYSSCPKHYTTSFAEEKKQISRETLENKIRKAKTFSTTY